MPISSKIIYRVLNETSSRNEAREIVEWFSQTIEGQHHLSDLIDRDAYIMEYDADTGKSFTPLQSENLFNRIEKNIRNKRLRRFFFTTAAIFLPMMLLLGLGYYISSRTTLFQATEYVDLYIPKGESGRLFFQDGTEVFLNSDTRIRYPQRFGFRTREVYLDGEAYFNVAPNSKRPFIVNAQKTFVRVAGTSFNVNAYSENETIQVVLEEGKTSFHVNGHSYYMSPGQKIEYTKNTGNAVLINLSNPSNVSLWKNNILYFHDTPLIEALKVLERKHDVQFNLKSPEALNYSYTITTKNKDIDSVLFELQKIAPVRFEKIENNIFVSLNE